MLNKYRLKFLPDLSRIMFSVIVCYPVYSSAMQERGHVSVRGYITETPCTIDIQNHDQSVVTGMVPLSAIMHSRQGFIRPFYFRLINCTLARLDSGRPAWRYFRAYFDGSGQNGRFMLSGHAQGVALELTDMAGNPATPGMSLSPGILTEGDLRLSYHLHLVGNGQKFRPGEFHSIIRFRMDYY